MMFRTLTLLAATLASGTALAHVETACFTPSPGQSTPGATITLAQGAQVHSKFCGSDAGYTSDLYLAAPQSVYIATGHVTPAGRTVDIGAYNSGSELVFSIYVRNTGLTYYSGPGSRNPDGQVHAAVMKLPSGEYHVGFEDLFGGGDRDYNDIIFIIRLETTDQDGDGVGDSSDNCKDVPNADQADADGDGQGNACDACPQDAQNDADADGVCGNVDNCPSLANPNQENYDGDAQGDACDSDDDNDGVADTADNCPLAPNADQANYDGDSAGNACDTDDDNDGVVDGSDACLFTAAGAVIDGTGCSIADYCPCVNSWKNHGAYVSCTAKRSEAFLAAGLITQAQKDATVSAAAGSTCGDKK